NRLVTLGPSIPEELPHVPHFPNHVQVHVRDDNVILVAFADGQHLPARVAEIALAVELADAPRILKARPINGADEVLVRHGVRRLLELPQVLRQPGHGGRRVEYDLGPVQPEAPRPFREVPVVADVDADLADPRLEHRVTEVAGPEIKLLPE